MDAGARKAKYESDFHCLLASVDQLISRLMTPAADSQLNNNNIKVTLK